MATPWLGAAIEENIGNGNTVEVGGTQIERAGRIRIAVRIRDIVVRDRDHAIVASAPKAEVRLSGAALLMGQLRAESLNLVDAELAVRITPDGYVTVSTGDTANPLATGVASKRLAAGAANQAANQAAGQAAAQQPGSVPLTSPVPPGAQPGTAAPTAAQTTSGLLAGLDWLDSLTLTGLDGQNLNEIGLKNGVLVVDDQQRGNKWTFENISLSLRRPRAGGVALSVGEEGAHAWSLRAWVAPFKVVSGANRVTLLAHLEPPNDNVTDWQLGLSGGTIVLAGNDNEPPLIFNRINVGFRFDTYRKRVLLTQADISNGEIGIAGTGGVDYSGEPRLTLGFAGTPMPASALKRIWPILIVPEVREWVIERVERGSLQRIEVGVNSPVRNLSRRGPPIPDDGLAVNIVASGVAFHPVAE